MIISSWQVYRFSTWHLLHRKMTMCLWFSQFPWMLHLLRGQYGMNPTNKHPAHSFLLCLGWFTCSSAMLVASCLFPGFCYNCSSFLLGYLAWKLLDVFCSASDALYSPSLCSWDDDLRPGWGTRFKGYFDWDPSDITTGVVSISSLLDCISKHWGGHTYNMALRFSSHFCFYFISD